mgnify:CR=1 FL=1
MKIKTFILFLLSLSLLVSCKNKDGVDPEGGDPGAFGLTQLQGNKRIRKQVINGITYVPYDAASANRNQRTTNTVSFDLGRIKASKTFYFILSNTGDQPITNVTIESNDPQYEVFPKSIDNIAPAKEGGVVPLLEVGVIHGNRLNGLNFQGLLPMGGNMITLNIKGKTRDTGGEINVELIAEAKLFAEVMAVEFYIDEQKQRYRDDVGNYQEARYLTESQIFKIKNIGNVDIKLQHHVFTNESLMVPVVDETSVLLVGQMAEFPSLRQTLSTTQTIGRVFMDGQGAAFNPNHLAPSILKPGSTHSTYIH